MASKNWPCNSRSKICDENIKAIGRKIDKDLPGGKVVANKNWPCNSRSKIRDENHKAMEMLGRKVVTREFRDLNDENHRAIKMQASENWPAFLLPGGSRRLNL